MRREETMPISWKITETTILAFALYVGYYFGIFIMTPLYEWLGILQGDYVRFAHISDTHIKNLKYHHEYQIVFEQLYETLRKEDVDYIVHCGDIAHTKTQISPEFVEMCS